MPKYEKIAAACPTLSDQGHAMLWVRERTREHRSRQLAIEQAGMERLPPQPKVEPKPRVVINETLLHMPSASGRQRRRAAVRLMSQWQQVKWARGSRVHAGCMSRHSCTHAIDVAACAMQISLYDE